MSARLATIVLLLWPLACTIKSVDKTAEGTGGTPSVVEAGADAATACGDVTDKGVCDRTEFVYCKAGALTRVDCTKIGATCQATGGSAACALSRAETCGSLTALGECVGATIRYCDATGKAAVPKEINCAAYGQICDPTGASDGGAICKPQGPCPATMPVPVENGTCTGNELSFCEGGQLYAFDCGVNTCKAVAGVSDCFMAGVSIGCAGTTVGCSGTTAVSCQGGIETHEDCAALGLECQNDGTCRTGAACPATCPSGYACASGRCSPTTTPAREWTIAAYIVGDNNLADAAFDDLNEMETVASSAAVQIAAEIEFSAQYSTQPPTSYLTGVWRMPIVADQDPEAAASLAGATNVGDMNMSEPANLAAFVKWAAETYPAKRFALVVWNHGGGYQGGFVDSSHDGEMSLRQLVDGVRMSGVHPGLIAFDACLMGMHEVAMAFRGLADVLVASEEAEPGRGYPYDRILPRVTGTPTMTAAELGTAITEEYAASYSTGLRVQSTTQAALDLTKAESVNRQLAAFSQTLLTEMPGNRGELRNAIGSENIMRFKMRDSADVPSALTELSSIAGNIGTAAAAFKTFVTTDSGYVLSTRGTALEASAGGVALYLPAAAFSAYSTGTFESYRTDTAFLPLAPWHAVLANLTSGQDVQTADAGPAPATAVNAFSVVLRWASVPDGTTSGADLDLYVYEPSGDFGTPSNGTFTENAVLSADSYDTGLPNEAYELKPDHQAGTYIVLAHVYDIPAGEKAYPRLQIVRSDLPGGSRTLVRGKFVNSEIQETPMDNSAPLTTSIDSTNLPGVMNLDYTNIWYAATIEVIP